MATENENQHTSTHTRPHTHIHTHISACIWFHELIIMYAQRRRAHHVKRRSTNTHTCADSSTPNGTIAICLETLWIRFFYIYSTFRPRDERLDTSTHKMDSTRMHTPMGEWECALCTFRLLPLGTLTMSDVHDKRIMRISTDSENRIKLCVDGFRTTVSLFSVLLQVNDFFVFCFWFLIKFWTNANMTEILEKL